MTAETHRKCGMKQPHADNFGDVKRALHAWLMEHNEAYREASHRQSARVAQQLAAGRSEDFQEDN